MIKFTINGETVSKKNGRQTTRSGKSLTSDRYNAWHELAVIQIRQQMRNQHIVSPLNEPVAIDLVFYHSDKRRRDSDNGVSSMFDTLVDAQALGDDNWKIVRSFKVLNLETVGDETAHCEICIHKHEEM